MSVVQLLEKENKNLKEKKRFYYIKHIERLKLEKS